MKNREKDAKNRARSNTRIGRRAEGSVPGLDHKYCIRSLHISDRLK